MMFPPIRKFAVLLPAAGALAVGGGPADAQTSSITISTPVTLSAPSCKDGFALSGAFPNQTLVCAGTPTPTAGPPTGCQIGANPAALSGTGSVQLTVSCGGGAPTNYSWSASPAVTFTGGASTAGNTNGALITQTTAFTVVATNAASGSSTATTSVQVGGGGGGTGAVSCSSKGFATTQYYDWDWNLGGLTIYTDLNSSNVHNSLGPIGPNGIVVIGFTPTSTAFGATGSLSIAPYPGDLASTTRTVSVSTTACDFSAPFPWTRTGDDAGVQFTVGDFIPRVYPPLVAGTKYYINIAARDAAGTSTCANAGRACDMVIQASRP